MQKRTISSIIEKDLESKMVFLTGPRQTGKTTISKDLIKKYQGIYYNWDNTLDQKKIKENKIDPSKSFIVFDEIHKYRNWKNWLKGTYDKLEQDSKILVTGSAKLNLFQKGGDSLQGRYFLHRLHPFTLAELLNFTINDIEEITQLQKSPKEKEAQKIIQDLLRLGSFPEPYLSGSEKTAQRWRLSYGQRLVREDIRDLENINYFDKLETLYEHLPNTVASPLSLNSLRKDLEVSFESVRDWVSILEKNYACFRIPPLGGKNLLKNIRAVKKEQKLYMWDHCLVQNEGARFENLIACHLLKLVHHLEDCFGEKVELRYFKDSRGHEVDFIVLKNSKPWFAVEVKLSQQSLDKNMKYLLERVKVPYAFQIHLNGDEHYKVDSINSSEIIIMPAWFFLANLI